jgi:hypothetical protein
MQIVMGTIFRRVCWMQSHSVDITDDAKDIVPRWYDMLCAQSKSKTCKGVVLALCGFAVFVRRSGCVHARLLAKNCVAHDQGRNRSMKTMFDILASPG